MAHAVRPRFVVDEIPSHANRFTQLSNASAETAATYPGAAWSS